MGEFLFQGFQNFLIACLWHVRLQNILITIYKRILIEFSGVLSGPASKAEWIAPLIPFFCWIKIEAQLFCLS